MIGIPQRFALETIDNRGWTLRNVAIHHKSNCLPESVKDRFTDDFGYFFFFAKNKKYYFEQQFEPIKQSSIERFCRVRRDTQKWINWCEGQTVQGQAKPLPNIKHRKMEGTKYGGDGVGLHDHFGYYDADGSLDSIDRDAINAVFGQFQQKGLADYNMLCLHQS